MRVRVRVLDTAEAARAVLACLDFRAIDKLLLVLQPDDAWRSYLQDSGIRKELIQLHFGGRLESERSALPKKARTWPWTNPKVACAELQEFLRISDERDHFMKTVSVVRGDISKLQEIEGIPLDAIAFPANVFLANRCFGVSGAIFRRAGKALTDHMGPPDVRFPRNYGDVVSTPAFDAACGA